MILDELVTVLTYKINNNAEMRRYMRMIDNAKKSAAALRQKLNGRINTTKIAEFKRILANAQQSARKLRSEINKSATSYNAAAKNATKLQHKQEQTTKSAKEMVGWYGRLRGIVAGVFSVMGAMSFARMADEYASSTASIKLAADSGNVKAVQDQIYKNSQATGTDYTSNVDLFASVARNKNELGLGDMDAVKLSDTVSKAIAITSKGAGADGAAILQFSQALGSGRLGGDELRSILENSGGLARAIADSFGVSVGKLKEMGAKGELTADKLAKGLLEQSKNINEQFEKLPKTFGKGWQKVRNAMKKTAGDIAENTRLAEGFYWITSKIADNFEEIAKFVGFGGLTGALMLFNANLGKVKGKIKGLALAARPLLLPFLKMAAILYGLQLIGEDIMVWMQDGNSAIGTFLGDFEDFKNSLDWLIDPIRDFIDELELGEIGIDKIIMGISLLAVAIWLLTSPIALVILAILGIVAAGLYVYSKWDDICKWLSDTWREWIESMGGDADKVNGFFSDIWDAVCRIFDFITNVFKLLWGVLTGDPEAIKQAYKEICKIIDEEFTALGNNIAAMWDFVAGLAKSAWDGVIGWIDRQIKRITDFLGITDELAQANQAMKGGKNDWDGNWGNKTTNDTKQGSVGSVVGAIQGAAALTKKFANSELGQNIAASAKSYAKNGLPVTPVGTVPAHKTNNQTNTQHNNNTFNITTIEAMKTQEIANATSSAAKSGWSWPNVERGG